MFLRSNPEASSAMGQVQWQRSRSASRRRRPAARGPRPLWDIGLIRHRFDGNSIDGAADRWSCPRDQNVLCFHSLPTQEPAPYRDCRGSLRRDVGVKLRPQPASARTREWMARRHRARRPDTRLAANFPRENRRGRATAAAGEWTTQDWRSGRLRLLGGACHRGAAAEYQKPAANRSFKGSR